VESSQEGRNGEKKWNIDFGRPRIWLGRIYRLTRILYFPPQAGRSCRSVQSVGGWSSSLCGVPHSMHRPRRLISYYATGFQPFSRTTFYHVAFLWRGLFWRAESMVVKCLILRTTRGQIYCIYGPLTLLHPRSPLSNSPLFLFPPSPTSSPASVLGPAFLYMPLKF
jgi:hypothetical protein